MKFKLFSVLNVLLLLGLVSISCENPTGGEKKSIASELIGKWELKKVVYQGTTYTLPCNFMGVPVNSGGYTFGLNSITTYANGLLAQKTSDIYSEGNSIFNSSGQSGVTWSISGNTLTITSILETDICERVNKFSWE
jgi:hypothetical protein